VSLQIPTSDFGADHLLGDVFWVSDAKLGAIWLNRRQNRAIFVTYSPPQSAYTKVIELNEPNGWIDINSPKCSAGICIFISNRNNWPTLTTVNTNTNAVEYHTANKHVLTYYGTRNGKL
jgi:Dipeptidyl peptidase IV (DPP IV) N-terminal region